MTHNPSLTIKGTMTVWLVVGGIYVVEVITKKTEQRELQITLRRTLNASSKGNRSDVECINKINLHHVLEIFRL